MLLRIKNKVNNKSRMLAGYCYNWLSKKDPTAIDIKIGDSKLNGILTIHKLGL